jgi:hypothetical protein
MAEVAQSGAWAIAILCNGSGDKALRQTEAIPAHLSMVIAESHHGKEVSEWGSERAQGVNPRG